MEQPEDADPYQELADQRKKQLHSLRAELGTVERRQREMERKGVELERQLRSNEDMEGLDDRLVEEWFTIVSQKNLLLRQVRLLLLVQPTLCLCLVSSLCLSLSLAVWFSFFLSLYLSPSLPLSLSLINV